MKSGPVTTAHFRKAVVVGASSGIGEAIAKRLAAEGAELALVARRTGELERVASEIPSGSPRPRCYTHDVRDYDAAPGLFEQITHDMHGIDLVVYAAGVMPDVGPGEYTFAKDYEMISVNVLGAMAWLDLAAAAFASARQGTILGISSIAGERGRRGSPAYSASKAALSTYLESLRNRLSGYGVNVVTIKPGYVDTAMTRGKKGMFWVISPGRAADDALAAARSGSSATVFVPRRWQLVALLIKLIPSPLFRRLNF
jgi:decaprenylphospho-beta-D-erythro-pentofuranosid-2-ulose 2-reductase